MKSNSLITVKKDQGWKLGLKNMLSHENAKWWKSQQWWVQAMVWGILINGLLVMLLFLMPAIAATFDGVQQSELANLPDGISAFFSFAGFALPIGSIITIQGSITQEKELGTMEWILSKPISKTAYLLAKMISQTIGILFSLVVFQSALAFLIISIKSTSNISIVPFLFGTLILAMDLLFYITLTFMLEVISKSRSLVMGISLGCALGGAIIVNLFPFLGLVTPFALPGLMGAVANNLVPSNFPLWAPLVGTSISSLIFLLISIRQINRLEI